MLKSLAWARTEGGPWEAMIGSKPPAREGLDPEGGGCILHTLLILLSQKSLIRVPESERLFRTASWGEIKLNKLGSKLLRSLTRTTSQKPLKTGVLHPVLGSRHVIQPHEAKNDSCSG